MANRLIAGFDDVDASTLAYEWNVNGTPEIVTGRTGNCIRLGNGEYIWAVFAPEGQQIVTIGFAYRVAAIGAASYGFMGLGSQTGTHIYLILTADGHVDVERSGRTVADLFNDGAPLGTSTFVVTENVWVQIQVEVKIANAPDGYVKVRFNGSTVNDIDVSGVDTLNGSVASVMNVAFRGYSISNVEIDDVWVNDPTGTVCTGFMGDRQVDTHFPIADGAYTAWDNNLSPPDEGYKAIDEAVPDVTDYIYAETAVKSVFDFENFKNNGADIEAIQVNAITRKSDVGICAVRFLQRESGVDTLSDTDLYPSTSWATQHVNYSIAEADNRRHASGFNATEWGVEKVL